MTFDEYKEKVRVSLPANSLLDVDHGPAAELLNAVFFAVVDPLQLAITDLHQTLAAVQLPGPSAPKVLADLGVTYTGPPCPFCGSEAPPVVHKAGRQYDARYGCEGCGRWWGPTRMKGDE